MANIFRSRGPSQNAWLIEVIADSESSRINWGFFNARYELLVIMAKEESVYFMGNENVLVLGEHFYILFVLALCMPVFYLLDSI